jgi:drug/metabolite transporter (DMT)-like permease
MNRSILWGIANGVAAGALWGIIFLVPAVLQGYTPLQLALGRYLAYGAISAVLLLPRLKRFCLRFGLRDWLTLAWLSVVGNLMYYALVAFAVQSAGGAANSLWSALFRSLLRWLPCLSPIPSPCADSRRRL